ncbi:Zinc finger, CCHC-type [Sesbania bispinosa]|nr:Zinc finger, CCHC-type [Sesbania bispinosa]
MEELQQVQNPAAQQSDEECAIELESNELESLQLAKRSLLCKIMIEKPLNRAASKSILIKAWGDPKEVQVIDMGVNTFLFTFCDKKEVKTILQRGPWGKLMRTFIRVRALMDIRKPLPTSCWIPRKDLPKIWIFFKFEKLQGICFNCGTLGHEQKSCKENKAMATVNPTIPKYGPKLGVPPAKSLTAIMQEQQLWSFKQQQAMEENPAGWKMKRPTQQSQEAGREGGSQSAETNASEETQRKEDTYHSASDRAEIVSGGKDTETQIPEAAIHRGQKSLSQDSLIWGQEMGPHAQEKGQATTTIVNLENNGPPGDQAQPKNSKFPIPQPGPDQGQEQAGLEQEPNITLIDLQKGQKQAGLGPSNIEQLGIQKEFIGLKEPVIIVDYPSPEIRRYEGITLSDNEIKQCKKACISDNSLQDFATTDTISIYKKGEDHDGHSREGIDYFVELPEEDNGSGDQNKGNNSSIPEIIENHLIQGLNHALSLKRPRRKLTDTEADSEPGAEGDYLEHKRAKYLQWTNQFEEGNNTAGDQTTLPKLNLILMAGEAGQNMPHPQP